jgi:hypothetical protein
MRVGLALSLLLSAMVAGVVAGVAVLIDWSAMAGVPNAVSPALWAARAYVAYFDMTALAAFLPSFAVCLWIRGRAVSNGSPGVWPRD